MTLMTSKTPTPLSVPDVDWASLQTPCYLVDEQLLIRNLEILDTVQKATGCKILLAQKAFSMYSAYPLIRKYLHGTTASSLFEAKLGYEEMGGEVHVFAPAYSEQDFDALLGICDHIVFNSFSQWRRFRERVRQANGESRRMHRIECGIRVNPEYSEIETDLYNPCFIGSRLGVTAQNFEPAALGHDECEDVRIDGLHFHTMCEQNSDTLKRTLAAFEDKFGQYLHRMKWVNFGGGHHITREDYDLDVLISCIRHISETYQVEVYLEPGEAVALNTGFLVASVLDTVRNGVDIAILDTSAACHMPDVLEMPYLPMIVGAGNPGEKPHCYRLGGPTCLAGDVIGDYSFDEPLKAGDRLVFCDMAHYTMVKNNTFNGINLPRILMHDCGGVVNTLREFGYDDFKKRLS